MLTPLLLALVPFATTPRDSWRTEIVFQAPDKLGACVIGDVDRTSRGLEIVTACRNGDLYMVYREDDHWQTKKIGSTPGEMIQLAIGDVRPDHLGLEIIAVGSATGPEVDEEPGAAWSFHLENGRWVAEHIYSSDRLLHAVAVDRTVICVAGYDRQVTGILFAQNKVPTFPLAELPGAAKCGLVHGRRAFFACNDGSVVSVAPDSSPKGADAKGLFPVQTLDQRSSGRARMGTDGQHLVVCDDDGTLSLLDFEGNREVVYKENDKLRGAVLADLDPERPGPEIATVGYERRLTILTLEGDVWQPTPVLIETDKFHGLTSGDLDGDGDHELVACGYSGRLILVDRNRR